MYFYYILLLSTLILKVRSEIYPPFYALDLDDGYGMQLLASWGKNCPFYRNKDSVVDDGILYFYKDSASVWSVSKSGSYQKPYNKCPEIIKSATLLFTLPDAAALPSREGWYNVTKAKIIGAHNETVTLNLREVETCKIYTNAYFNFTGSLSPSPYDVDNFEKCNEKAQPKTLFKGANDYKLISTKTINEKIKCSFAMKSQVEGSIVNDPDAKFMIISEDCSNIESRNLTTEEWKSGLDLKTEEEADGLGRGLEHEIDDNFKSVSEELEDNSMLVAIGGGAGAGVLILAMAIFALLRYNKKKEDRSGNRESIDLNQQYGADEYYEYMKHDTNVVDDNDMYNYGDGDYED